MEKTEKGRKKKIEREREGNKEVVKEEIEKKEGDR